MDLWHGMEKEWVQDNGARVLWRKNYSPLDRLHSTREQKMAVIFTFDHKVEMVLLRERAWYSLGCILALLLGWHQIGSALYFFLPPLSFKAR